jgi:tetratricopeptide (TPR) repeat protein
MKRLILLFLLTVLIFPCGYRKPYKYTIDAGKDAFWHNNVGINYLQDRIYYAAIQEFKIAIQLSPNTQATSVFKNNLGETYNYIGYPDMARICFEDSIKLYGLNFKYYLNLADCYANLGISQAKIEEYKKSDSIYDKIMLGLLYIKTGETRRGVIQLDEICQANPELLIVPAIRNYLKDAASAL